MTERDRQIVINMQVWTQSGRVKPRANTGRKTRSTPRNRNGSQLLADTQACLEGKIVDMKNGKVISRIVLSNQDERSRLDDKTT